MAPNPRDRDRLAPVRPGDLLAGKYRVERVLGVGGMGVVVAARHEALRQRVALKFLLPDVGAEPEAVERFAREARAMAALRGEHVARVLDVGTLESGAPYFVMEYLEGEDLARACKRRGPLPGEEAVGYVLQACEALAEAHRVGMVHRDLKPANLFLTRGVDGSPVVKVLDFGVTKVTSSTRGDGFDLTSTSALMGSPRYMAPEQLRDARRVDARADVWSLGVVAHELLAGESPFDAETLPELHVAILQNPPRALRARRPDVPPALAAAVARCLEKDPAARFPHVAALAEALAPFGPPAARAAVGRIASVLGVAPPTAAAPGRGSSHASGRHSHAPSAPSASGSHPPAPAVSASGPHSPAHDASASGPHPPAQAASSTSGPGGTTSVARPARATAALPTPPPSRLGPPVAQSASPSAWQPAPGPSAAGPSGASMHPPAPRVVPPTVAASPSPAVLDGPGRSSGPSFGAPHAPAPAQVPYPFEGGWGHAPAPLAPVPPPLALQRQGPSNAPKIAAIVLGLLVVGVTVFFGGCLVCVGLLGAS